MPLPSRRRFFRVATSGIAAGLLALRGSPRALADRPGALERVERRSFALGSEIQFVVLHEKRAVAEAALAKAFDEIELVERMMSIYRADSQLSRLNRDGVLSEPHALLVDVLLAAQRISERSAGAFDVTVQPLWELFSAEQKKGRLPDESQIAAARGKVNWRRLDVTPRRVRLLDRGMAVTLNGIAQGFAADRVVAVLRTNGIEHALVNSGEIGAIGTKEDARPWSAGVQDPRHAEEFAEVVALDGRFLSTSGDYATVFSPDFVNNHIFDPATGHSPLEFSSVSVVAPSGTEADALSTAIFVAGPEKGVALLEQTPRCDALLISKNGRVHRSPGFPTKKSGA